MDAEKAGPRNKKIGKKAEEIGKKRDFGLDAEAALISYFAGDFRLSYRRAPVFKISNHALRNEKIRFRSRIVLVADDPSDILAFPLRGREGRSDHHAFEPAGPAAAESAGKSAVGHAPGLILRQKQAAAGQRPDRRSDGILARAK